MSWPRFILVSAALLSVAAGSLASTPTSATAAPKKASTFSATLPLDESGQVETATLTTLDNGLLLRGSCNQSGVALELSLGLSISEYLALGFSFDNGLPTVQSGPHSTIVAVGDHAALALIAGPSSAGTPVGRFTRLDIQGDSGTPCRFWGMIIPAD